MRKRIIFFILAGIAISVKSQIINFPDQNFKNALLHNPADRVDLNQDGEIQISEANSFLGTLYINNKNITDLTGIEHFIKMSQLDCYDNQITNLDLSKNVGLVQVNCFNNKLTNLDITKNILLRRISCGTNLYTSLDVSKNTALTLLYCNDTQLTSLNIDNNTALESLWCYGNKLTSLDVSNNTKLNYLDAGNNLLTNIDVSKLTSVEQLYLHNNKLSNIDVSKNLKLDFLRAENNQLTNLDFSKNINLARVDCFNNQITSIDLSYNPKIKYLFSYNNLLKSLNLKTSNISIIEKVETQNNPDLTCIQVDDLDYANIYTNAGWWKKDASASYSIDCSLAITEVNKKEILLYPNPAKENLNFSEEINNIKVSDLSGKVIKQISNSEKSINVSKLPKGTYIISAITKTGETINKKFIKE